MQPTPDFTWLFIKMMAGLVICLGLAIVFLRVVLPRTRMGKSARRDWVSILDTVRVDQRKSLHMIKIAERYFVLGAGEESLNLIAELSPAEWEKAVAADSQGGKP